LGRRKGDLLLKKKIPLDPLRKLIGEMFYKVNHTALTNVSGAQGNAPRILRFGDRQPCFPGSSIRFDAIRSPNKAIPGACSCARDRAFSAVCSHSNIIPHPIRDSQGIYPLSRDS